MRNSDEFFDSADDIFDDDFGDDYQTDTDDSDEDTSTEPTEEPQHADSEDSSEDEDEVEDGAEDEDEPDSDSDDDKEGEDGDDNTGSGETFTLKVNKEEKQVYRDEVITLAQKGMDYDRVKEQNAKHQQTITDLQSKLDGFSSQQTVLDILDNIAQKSGSTMEQLAESLYVNFRKSAGASEDTAREELKNAKLEKELNSYKTQKTQQQEKESDSEARAKRDLENFAREYPDVELTEELVDKLVPDIQNGMSLSAAYRKYEKAKDAERIADLERQIANKAQKKKNKAKAVGSKRDSGAGSSPDLADIFERELFK